MRTRTKIILTILMAAITFWLFGCASKTRRNDTANRNSRLPAHLDKWYAAYNEEYFNNTLPKDVVIDWGLSGEESIATTIRMSDKRFHIAFNDFYARAERVAHTTLLHEMCHIPTYDEDEGADGAFPDLTQIQRTHGPQWRACMLRIDGMGAFRRELIDGYDK